MKKVFGRKRKIWSTHEAALHIVRTVCRARALSKAVRGRNDVEGIDDVDIEATSQKPWVRFYESLTRDQQSRLGIFRCGASATDTRRYRDAERRCRHCDDVVWPSMRHLVAECKKFSNFREQASEALGLNNRWWRNLPRVSSKSGWITFGAHRCPQRRSAMQVAICRLGLIILDTVTLSNRDPAGLPTQTSCPNRGGPAESSTG